MTEPTIFQLPVNAPLSDYCAALREQYRLVAAGLEDSDEAVAVESRLEAAWFAMPKDEQIVATQFTELLGARRDEREACAAILDAEADELKMRLDTKAYDDHAEANLWRVQLGALRYAAKLVRERESA